MSKDKLGRQRNAPEIERYCRAATPGPWRWIRRDGKKDGELLALFGGTPRRSILQTDCAYYPDLAVREGARIFITQARTDLPAVTELADWAWHMLRAIYRTIPIDETLAARLKARLDEYAWISERYDSV